MTHSAPPPLSAADQKRLVNARQAFLDLAEIAALQNIRTRAFKDPSLPNYMACPVPQQELILEELTRRISVYREALSAGDNINHSPRLIWRLLGRLELRTTTDFYEKLEDDDAVEIYSSEHVLKFCTLNTYAAISYTLEEIHSRPWYELYEREDLSLLQLQIEWSDKVLRGEFKTSVRAPVPDFTVHEKFSDERQAIRIQHRFLSPLNYSDGVIGGYAHVMRAELI